MISGRLGNDFGDFAVMADNACPDYSIGIPWQSAGSVFKETWSYRSWQKRDNLNGKISEKTATLKNIVKHGGNYLLNIGPRGDGSVVEFERDLLIEMGKWLRDSSNVIYSQNTLTATDKKPIFTNKLTYSNASPMFGYSCFDYYSSFRSIIGYRWFFTGQKVTPYIIYHTGDAKKELLLNFNGKKYPIQLSKGVLLDDKKSDNNICISNNFILTKGRSSFDEKFIDTNAFNAINRIYTKTDLSMAQEYGWNSVNNLATGNTFIFRGPAKWKTNIWIAHIIESEKAGGILAKFSGDNDCGAADAIEIWLNGKQLTKKGFTNTLPSAEYVNLPIIKGRNTLVVKLHNRFENQINYTFTTNIPQQWYKLALPFEFKKDTPNELILSPQHHRGGADIGLRDIRIEKLSQ